MSPHTKQQPDFEKQDPQSTELRPWVKAAREFCEYLLTLPNTDDNGTLQDDLARAKVEDSGNGSCKVTDFVGWRDMKYAHSNVIKEKKITKVVTEEKTGRFCYLADEVRKAVKEIAEKHGVRYEFYVEGDNSHSRGPSIPPACYYAESQVSLVFMEK